MQLPNITQAQIAALVTAVAGIATTLGLNFSNDLPNQLTEVLVAVFGAISVSWHFADAHIRGKRADNATALNQLKGK